MVVGNARVLGIAQSTLAIARDMLDDHSGPGTVLVTGARGFVGSHLCRILAEHGWRVLATSRNRDPNKPVLGIVPVVLPMLADDGAWQAALIGVDCIVHLAARVHQLGSGKESAAEFRIANVATARFVAEQAARAGVRRFVFLSSIKVNGEGGSLKPYVSEDVPHPVDEYGRSKLEAERNLGDFCRTTGVELVIIRPPLVYGPGVRANFERLLRLAASGMPLPLRSIRNRRSLIGVVNLANFIETCLAHPAAARKTWLVSDGEDLSTPQLFEKLAHLMHRPARLLPCDPAWLRFAGHLVGLGGDVSRLCDSLVVDIGATRAELGWIPQVSVDEGLASTVEAYCKSRRA